MIKPVIELKNVSIRLPEKEVFQKTTWKLLRDQHWVITGPTGSGKSIFARALCGELPFVGGQVDYAFPDGDEFPDEKIAYVNFDAIRQMKSDDSLFIQARYWSCDDSIPVNKFLSEQQVKQINPFEVQTKAPDRTFKKLQNRVIALLQIEPLLSKHVNQLSFGESKKVLLARALLKNPAVLILDNPFQGLDIHFRKYLCSTIIPELTNHGLQLIILAHNCDELPACITNHLIIDQCRIIKNLDYTPQKKSEKSLTKTAPLNLKTFSPKNLISSHFKNELLVEINDLTYKLQNQIIFDNLTWTIHKGEHWGLFGKNGSGKTTLLSLILGDNPQMYAHDIKIFGKRWGKSTNIWEVKKRIGWVSPELQTCFPHTDTCLEVVCSGFFDTMGLFSRCPKKYKESSLETLKLLNLSSYAEEYFGTVSEGVQRLILLARAMVKKPDLLILDEPCQGIDEKLSNLLIKNIEKIASFGSTLIFVSHDPHQIPRCITNVLTL